MSIKSSIGIAVSKGRQHGDDRKLATAKRNLTRDPSKARLDDKSVHERAIDKQLKLAHQAEDQIEPVLNTILDAVERSDVSDDVKTRLITIGDTAARDREEFKTKLENYDSQAKDFKTRGGNDPLVWTMTSLSICSEIDSARNEYVQTVAGTLQDVQSTISKVGK